MGNKIVNEQQGTNKSGYKERPSTGLQYRKQYNKRACRINNLGTAGSNEKDEKNKQKSAYGRKGMLGITESLEVRFLAPCNNIARAGNKKAKKKQR